MSMQHSLVAALLWTPNVIEISASIKAKDRFASPTDYFAIDCTEMSTTIIPGICEKSLF